MGPKSDWTPERLELAQGMWKAGASGNEIGDALGVSRSAVLGKLNRLGLVRRDVEGYQRPAPVMQPPRKHRVTDMQVRIAARAKAAAQPEAKVVILNAPNARPWITRQFGECAAPVMFTDDDTWSCCEPAEPGRPYCPGHCQIYYVPSKPQVVKAPERMRG